MADEYKSRETELILAPGVYAFVLDETKGHINTLCGPIKQSLSTTDRLVVYDQNTMRFVVVNQQQIAIQTNIIAPKGCYVVLENPSSTGRQPEPGKAEILATGTLRFGQIVNLPGPESFPLWPGQVATVVKGHHLRSNQYLVVRVYDDEAAKANWDKSVVKGAADAKSGDDIVPDGAGSAMADSVLGINADTLVTGQLIIIRGTGVAFYIPPTGVEALIENGDYVRDAVTLERLEYAILVGEDGNKEYRKGPDVVFPTPTQKFFTKEYEGQNQRKFRAYELQPTNGVHIKVIADYEENDKTHKAGDELFITGSDMPIYYPREEHAIISYGGKDKSYAVAVPSGEGRYVLNRQTGNIALVVGPSMFLPNPMNEVIVRRVLTPAECELYFPGNQEVKQVNRTLTDSGIDAISDPASTQFAISSYYSGNQNPLRTAASATVRAGVSADQVTRSTVYTPPRMITLNTKFEGAIRIDVWSGYAVQVVNSKGLRHTVIGPQTVLLEYDEYLERLSLSKGTPKSDDQRYATPYLRYISNPVSDILTLKTQDLVNVEVRVKYLVRFEETNKDVWFAIDNYVQYMVDHLRSLIGNTVRNIGVQRFYHDATNILRDVVLGEKNTTDVRSLKHFGENGMTVYDLELISVTVMDRGVAELLARAQQETLSDSIALDRAIAKTRLITGMQEQERQQAQEHAATDEIRNAISRKQILLTNENEQQRKIGEQTIIEMVKSISEITLAMEEEQRRLADQFADLDAGRLIRLETAAAQAQKERMTAIAPRLVEALTAMAQTGQLESIAKHLAPLAIVNGVSLSGTLEHLMQGTPLEGMLRNLQTLNPRSVNET